MADPVTTQLAINAMLDVIWPLLPAPVIAQLAYV